MRIEHTGLQVEKPAEFAAWYCRHLGFRVVRALNEQPWTTFLVDAAGRGMLEIYSNPAAPLPDYRRQDPLIVHLAFDVGSDDIIAVRDRLLTAGASVAKDIVVTASGDRLIMLRDPWGLAIQLVQRKETML